MLCYTGGTTQASVQHSEPMSTSQVNQTAKPSTIVDPTGGGQDSPSASEQQEGQLLVLFESLCTYYFNSFPAQISLRSF